MPGPRTARPARRSPQVPDLALPATPRATAPDASSLGATLYHLLVGFPPLQGATPTKILLQHLEAAPPPLRLDRPDLPADLCECVDGLLAKDRDLRPATAAALLARLTGIATRLGVDPDRAPDLTRARREGLGATVHDA